MQEAIAVFRPGENPITGLVHFHNCVQKHPVTRVTINLKGFQANSTHAIHIHKCGIKSLENACDSACDHYNPTNELHGNIGLFGSRRHAGDLVNNITANERGEVMFMYDDPMLTDVQDLYGRTIVIHAGIDDLGIFRNDFSDPERQKLSATTGNSGKRIACAVIGRA